MPRESQQVRAMIASLEDGNSPEQRPPTPLAQAVNQARAAAGRGEFETAVPFQEQAVALAREAGPEREALITLSVLLYNLAGYYSQAERFADAVRALEEVVAIDQQTGHPDLESDRQALEAARQIASLTPEERERLSKPQTAAQSPGAESSDLEAQIQAVLAQLPPEQRAEAEAQMRQRIAEFQRMSPEEQASLLAAQQDAERRAQYEKAANQVRDAALAYVRRQAPRQAVLDFLEQAAIQSAEGEPPGSPWLEVTALCRALVALMKEEPIPPVPARYTAHFSAVQQEQ